MSALRKAIYMCDVINKEHVHNRGHKQRQGVRAKCVTNLIIKIVRIVLEF
jgi:hypothetical protein